MDKDWMQGTVFPPPFHSYWEKCCAEIGRIPDIRYIDELMGEEYRDFDGLCIRGDGEDALTLAVNRELNSEEAILTVLHEITHVVLFERGFWEVRAQVDFDMIETLVTCYASVLNDPLIDRILRKEGFAIDILLKRDLHKIMMWFLDPDWEMPVQDDPAFEMETLRLVRLYLSGDRDIEERADRLYRGQAQEVRERARHLLGIIGEIGYDSPEKQLICLEKLLSLSTVGRLLKPHSIHAETN